MEKILIEDFKMDKTKFEKSDSYRYAVLIAGSKNVWIYCAESNCHFTITVCVSASGLVIPLFYGQVQAGVQFFLLLFIMRA
jgi:hypothetical protein